MRLYSLDTYTASKRAKGTQNCVTSMLVKFIAFIYPETTWETANEFSIRYLQEERDHFDDIVRYINSDSLSEKSPGYIVHCVRSVIDWLLWNDREFSASERARIKQMLPRQTVLTEDETLTTPKIQTILIHSDVLLRAFILTLSSSGMRANELIGVKFSDMREANGCLYFHIPTQRMKARKAHDYRYSKEAAAAINEWMKVRDTYFENALKKTTKCLKQSPGAIDRSDYIFPFSYTLLHNKFKNALRSAQMLRRDENSGRYTIGFQAFRRWFDTTLKSHLSLNMANEIVGHDEGLSSNYRRYPREEVDKAYLEVEPYLRILAPEDYADLVVDTADALNEQKNTTAALAAEILRQRDEIKAMRLYIESTKKER